MEIYYGHEVAVPLLNMLLEALCIKCTCMCTVVLEVQKDLRDMRRGIAVLPSPSTMRGSKCVQHLPLKRRCQPTVHHGGKIPKTVT